MIALFMLGFVATAGAIENPMVRTNDSSNRSASSTKPIENKSVEATASIVPACTTTAAVDNIKKEIRERLLAENKSFENITVSYRTASPVYSTNGIQYALDYEIEIDPVKSICKPAVHLQCKQTYTMKLTAGTGCAAVLDNIETIDLLGKE
jgi:hypothetical protein